MAKAKKGRYTVLLFFLIIFPTSCNYEILGSREFPHSSGLQLTATWTHIGLAPQKRRKR